MEIRNIGELKGKIMVFGGVYSNLEALLELKEIATAEDISPQNIICTGDIVGYCAQPEECLRLIREWGIHAICGNVELQIRDNEADCGCNFDEGSRCDVLSVQWYAYAQRAVTGEMKQWLYTLPDHIEFEYQNRKGYVVHGSPEDVSQFLFRSTEDQVKNQMLVDLQADILLAGHCGLPFSQLLERGLWINAGVIGMPANDGSPHVWYATLKEANDQVRCTHHTFTYDHKAASEKMVEKGLPSSYAETLVTGIWDNCDILPYEETNRQGMPLTGIETKTF